MILGFFLGAILSIWLLSAILSFIWEKLTKRGTTYNTIIITTIIAGVIYFLFGNWSLEEGATVFIIVIIAVPILIWGRTERLKKKLKQEENKTK
jgi:membrane protein implicated in regulation of membrane protease activity